MKRRHQSGPSAWGRSTWGCGSKSPAWWAEDEHGLRTVVRYMPRNRAKNTPCCSGRVGSPRRRNSDTLLWFSLLMPFLSLLGMNRNWKCQELRHTEHSNYHMVTYFLQINVSLYRQISLHCTHTLVPHPVWWEQWNVICLNTDTVTWRHHSNINGRNLNQTLQLKSGRPHSFFNRVKTLW